MTEGEMLWYAGPGVYCDGVKVADLEINDLLQIILAPHGYPVIQIDDSIKQEQDQ